MQFAERVRVGAVRTSEAQAEAAFCLVSAQFMRYKTAAMDLDCQCTLLVVPQGLARLRKHKHRQARAMCV